VLAWQSTTLTSALRPGFEPERAANLLNGGAACYQVYRAADGRFVTLAAIEEKFWRNFCEAVGRVDLVTRQWEPMPQHKLIAELGAIFASRDAASWEATLGSVDCCFALVIEPRDVSKHPQIAARGMVIGSGDTVEALYPAHVDGQPPAARPSAAFVPVENVVARWSAST
jgi:alpha-methylacyl-CoA racemase